MERIFLYKACTIRISQATYFYRFFFFFYQTESILYYSISVKRRTILSLSRSDQKHRYLAYIAYSINDLLTMN